MKPGTNMDIPQALISLVLKEVTVALKKQQVLSFSLFSSPSSRLSVSVSPPFLLLLLQYRDIMGLIESFDRMSINRKYLKYKPVNDVRVEPGAWWRYAITAVLEEDVKRRTQMWSWKHIKEHRYVWVTLVM